jgi:hypothetical protein
MCDDWGGGARCEKLVVVQYSGMTETDDTVHREGMGEVTIEDLS